ncbi:MAG: protein kinase [Deltaproteobacteria bacterium]|nr:protein kinase [Deltaproteobacteria bacterium]
MPGAHLTGAILDGRYKVLEAIAEGAMGVVYRAERLKLGRIVAIKVLHDELPNELSSRKRFEIEAMAMAKLEHPHCASVLDVGMHDDKPFVVMDFVSGQDLKTLISQGRVAPARAVEIVRQVLSGLAHAHELGIIHRDIKPANIVLSQKAGLGDHVKVLDFGLARLQAETTSPLTTGIVLGTPAYMAPEQIRGIAIDARTDLYACGVLLMELLTGQKPFYSPKDDPIEVVSMHLKQPPPKLSELVPGVEFGELENIVARALAKAADDRYQSAQEFVNALEATRSGPIASTGERSGPASIAAEAISDSMMIPHGATRLGMVAVADSGAVSATLTGAASGPVLPASGPVSSTMAGVPSGPVPTTIPKVSSGPVAPRAFLRPDTPIPAEGHLGPLESPVIPARAETADPLLAVRPYNVAPIQVGSRNPDGLPYTRRQLAIAGGGVFAVVLLIAIIAAARGGDDSKDTVAAKPTTTTTDTGEIEMDPVRADDAAKTIARAAELAGNGERERAIDLLTKARRTYPDNADLPYQAGKLYFAKMWWTDGLKNFRDAIRLEPSYRSDPELIKLVLKGFITTPTYNEELSSFLRNDIGDPAKEFLEETSRDHPNAGKRARAVQELKRFR